MPGFPDFIVSDLPTSVAAELIGHLHDVPASLELQAWARDLQREVDLAVAQKASVLFPGGVEG